jgi:hypothetical protein
MAAYGPLRPAGVPWIAINPRFLKLNSTCCHSLWISGAVVSTGSAGKVPGVAMPFDYREASVLTYCARTNTGPFSEDEESNTSTTAAPSATTAQKDLVSGAIGWCTSVGDICQSLP